MKKKFNLGGTFQMYIVPRIMNRYSTFRGLVLNIIEQPERFRSDSCDCVSPLGPRKPPG